MPVVDFSDEVAGWYAGLSNDDAASVARTVDRLETVIGWGCPGRALWAAACTS
ncbi:MAG: hypothetical protein LBK42_10670 [Propionibacteriaceae bacterium]|nr:hypothetical protein [Propionibacteriaceae bacterium]